MALTTTAAYLQHNTGASGFNSTALQLHIDAAQKALERYANLPDGGFESGSKTDDFVGQGNPTVLLRCAPVTAVASVKTIDADGSTVLSTLGASSYRIYGDGTTGVLERVSNATSFSARSMRVRNAIFQGPGPVWEMGVHYQVAYTGGFESGAKDLELLELAVWQLTDITTVAAGTGGLASENLGAYSYSLLGADERLKSVASIVSRYRRRPFG